MCCLRHKQLLAHCNACQLCTRVVVLCVKQSEAYNKGKESILCLRGFSSSRALSSFSWTNSLLMLSCMIGSSALVVSRPGNRATQLSNTTSLTDMCTAPSTAGKTLDVVCFKRTKNQSSVYGQDPHWLWMSYRLKIVGTQALTLLVRSNAQACMPVLSQCLTWTIAFCIARTEAVLPSNQQSFPCHLALLFVPLDKLVLLNKLVAAKMRHLGTPQKQSCQEQQSKAQISACLIAYH